MWPPTGQHIDDRSLHSCTYKNTFNLQRCVSTQINGCSLSVPALSVTITTLQPGSKWDRRKADSVCIRRSLQKHTSLSSKQHICVNTKENPVVRSWTLKQKPPDANNAHKLLHSECMACTHVCFLKEALCVLRAGAHLVYLSEKRWHTSVCVTEARSDDVWWWVKMDDEKTRTEIMLSDWISLVRVTENTQIVSADLAGHSHTHACTKPHLRT